MAVSVTKPKIIVVDNRRTGELLAGNIKELGYEVTYKLGDQLLSDLPKDGRDQYVLFVRLDAQNKCAFSKTEITKLREMGFNGPTIVFSLSPFIEARVKEAGVQADHCLPVQLNMGEQVLASAIRQATENAATRLKQK